MANDQTAIAFFSATGNTGHLVDVLSGLLEERGHKTKRQAIRFDVEPLNDFDLAEEIYVAFPILGFGCPRFVEDYLRKLPSGRGRRAILFATGADYIGLNHNAFRSPARILKRLGYDVPYRRVFAAGCNWLHSISFWKFDNSF